MPYLLALTGINKRGSILHPLVNRGCRLPSLVCSRYTGYAYAALDMMKCTTKLTGEQFAVRWMETYVATNCTIRMEIGYQGNIDRYIVPSGGGSGSAVYYQSWQQPV